MLDIILASKSEIRKRLLQKLGLSFEVIVSEADETADLSKTFEQQLAEIAMRKAKVVFDITKNRSLRLIVAADQNIVFNNKMYGKPANLKEAELLIKNMRGSNSIFAYTGNALILADKDKILKCINNCDIAKLSMDAITDERVFDYIQKNNPLTKCGGITIEDCDFIHLVEGKLSTAFGITTEYINEMIESL